MWRDVFLHNKEAVLEVLGRFTEDLFALQRQIRWAEGDKLFRPLHPHPGDPPRHHRPRTGDARARLRPPQDLTREGRPPMQRRPALPPSPAVLAALVFARRPSPRSLPGRDRRGRGGRSWWTSALEVTPATHPPATRTSLRPHPARSTAGWRDGSATRHGFLPGLSSYRRGRHQNSRGSFTAAAAVGGEAAVAGLELDHPRTPPSLRPSSSIADPSVASSGGNRLAGLA